MRFNSPQFSSQPATASTKLSSDIVPQQQQQPPELSTATRAITLTAAKDTTITSQPPPKASTAQQPQKAKTAQLICFNFHCLHNPDATHVQIRQLHNACVFELQSEICHHKRNNYEYCQDQVSVSISPFVIAFPNGKAFKLDCCLMNILEEIPIYTANEAESYYNAAHKKSRGKSKAYKQLMVHQYRENSLMPTDPALLLLVHRMFLTYQDYQDDAVKYFPCSLTLQTAKKYNWAIDLQSPNTFYLNKLQVFTFEPYLPQLILMPQLFIAICQS